jgi:hypothetical protein
MEETYRARQCQPTTAGHALLVDRDGCRCGTGGGWAFSLGGAPPPPTVDVANDTTPCRGGNVTYVQVHKCSGTSIQSAMYARTCNEHEPLVPCRGTDLQAFLLRQECTRGRKFGIGSVWIMSDGSPTRSHHSRHPIQYSLSYAILSRDFYQRSSR